MEMSIWIAKFLGPVFLAASAPMIIRPNSIQPLADEFLKSPAIMYVSGILVLTGGLSIVNTHNRWELDWPLLITLFGWALVIAGISRIVSPKVVADVGGRMIGGSVITRLAGVVWGILGAFLTFKGYF